jgi:hypothetical protein
MLSCLSAYIANKLESILASDLLLDQVVAVDGVVVLGGDEGD